MFHAEYLQFLQLHMVVLSKSKDVITFECVGSSSLRMRLLFYILLIQISAQKKKCYLSLLKFLSNKIQCQDLNLRLWT